MHGLKLKKKLRTHAQRAFWQTKKIILCSPSRWAPTHVPVLAPLCLFNTCKGNRSGFNSVLLNSVLPSSHQCQTKAQSFLKYMCTSRLHASTSRHAWPSQIALCCAQCALHMHTSSIGISAFCNGILDELLAQPPDRYFTMPAQPAQGHKLSAKKEVLS